MALADFTTLRAKQASPSQSVDFMKVLGTASSTTGVICNSLWKATGAPTAGGTPGASATCDKSTSGALPMINPSAGELRAWFKRLASQNFGPCGVQLCDRLVHMGGLDGTSVIAQTVLTSALTRSTSGAGVMAGVEFYSAIGTTGQTFTCSYTNQAGTTLRTSQPVDIGTNQRGAQVNRLIPMSLQAGDTGVRAVATLTLSGSTGTAGNFGVTLYKPISPIIPLMQMIGGKMDPVLDGGGYASLIDNDACLFFLLYVAGPLNTCINIGTMAMFED